MSRSSKFNINIYRQTTLNHYRREYENIARSLFIWEGLPEHIPVEYMEKMLYHEGRIMMIEDALAGLVLTRYSETGKIDIYDRPTGYNVVSIDPRLNGRQLKADDVVIIKNNSNLTPTFSIVDKSVRELTEIAVTKILNQTLQRIPTILLTDSSMRQSLISVMEAAQNGDGPAVIGIKGFEVDSINPIDNRQEYLGQELREEERMVVGELLTSLGINNLEVSKKERLVAAEAEVNKQEVGINLLSYLKPREEAAAAINKMFGLNVSVKVNPLLTAVEDSPQEAEGQKKGSDEPQEVI